jgi:hypothetical protein
MPTIEVTGNDNNVRVGRLDDGTWVVVIGGEIWGKAHPTRDEAEQALIVALQKAMADGKLNWRSVPCP